jgi:hypothetical protein
VLGVSGLGLLACGSSSGEAADGGTGTSGSTDDDGDGDGGNDGGTASTAGDGTDETDGGETECEWPPAGRPLAEIAAGVGGFVLDGEAEGDVSGRTVRGVGDVNGDGLDDVMIAAPYASPNGSESGRVYVVFGKADTEPVSLSNLAAGTGGYVVDGAAGQRSGASASGAGDVNADGLADIVVGAGTTHDTYVVFGKADTAAVSLADVETGSGGFAVDRQARDVDGAGDVNGDGHADVMIGAPADVHDGVNSGRAYVVFGKADTGAVSVEDVAEGTGGFVVDGENDWDDVAWSVSGAGDVNGDGLADVLVGGRFGQDSPLAWIGRAYVVFGKTDTEPVALSAVAQGDGGFAVLGEPYERCGLFVGGAGDVNGDGLADVAIGAPDARTNICSKGRVYLVFGKTDTDAVSTLDVADGMGGFAVNDAPYHDSPFAARGTGDLDENGLADLVIGAPGGEGHVYLVLGKVDGAQVWLSDVVTGAGGFVLDGEEELDGAGGSVDGAGDVNGDGIPDLVIGAGGAEPNGEYSGRTYVVFGG